MKTIIRQTGVMMLLCAAMTLAIPVQGRSRKPKKPQAAQQVEQWRRFEVAMTGPADGNPFADVELTADFTNAATGQAVTVRGFYDGGGTYRVRFMPSAVGEWKYVTHSNAAQLDGLSGTFACKPSAGQNHGIVRAVGREFRYADSTLYFPVGTTAYAWIHMPADVRRQTLASLRAAQFDKIRMCVFPKHYALCKELPELYPYEILSDEHRRAESGSADEGRILGEGGSVKVKGSGVVFDKSRFNPAFFRHLEQCVDSLDAIGCQADLILFHPYDKGYWGFDQMTMQENRAYLRYLEARLSSFKNVWWSLANEYDYVKAKTLQDWLALIAEVRANDPYCHLVSIHGSTATYFPHPESGLTHMSVQDEGPVMERGRASIVRNIYPMPVVFDEARYEGNLPYRWGRMSGEEMIDEMWNGLVQGTYITHGECFQYHDGDFDTIFWAKGGQWRGESWRRVPFMRSVLADLPNALQMADVSRDDVTSTAGDGYYLVYFGDRMQDSWTFNLPQKNATYPKLRPGTKFTVEIIDTWNMTVRKVPTVFETGEVNDYRMYDRQMRGVRLPKSPYLMLRIKKAE